MPSGPSSGALPSGPAVFLPNETNSPGCGRDFSLGHGLRCAERARRPWRPLSALLMTCVEVVHLYEEPGGNRRSLCRLPELPGALSHGGVSPGQGPSGWQQPPSCSGRGPAPRLDGLWVWDRRRPTPQLPGRENRDEGSAFWEGVPGEKALGIFDRKPGTPCPSQMSPGTSW